MTPEESQVLEGCRVGDEAAWHSLFRAYGPDIGGFLKGMMRSTDVDDLVQRVFLSFLSGLDRFRGESSLRTWLLRTARNIALEELRRRSRQHRHLRAYADYRSQSPAAPGPDGQVHGRAELDRIHDLLEELDDAFREVWLLRELSELSVAETAKILGIPEATVRTRHHRARARLFTLLEENP